MRFGPKSITRKIKRQPAYIEKCNEEYAAHKTSYENFWYEVLWGRILFVAPASKKTFWASSLPLSVRLLEGKEGHYLPFVPDARHPLKRRNMPVISRKLPVVDILTNNDNNLRCLYNRPIFLRLLQVRSKVCIAEPLGIAEAAFLMPGCPVCLFLRFNSHLPGEPGLASVHWSKGWWRWWWQLDSCKAPVKSSPPTNQHPVFLWAGCPSCHQPTVSMHWRENITFHELAYPKLTWGSSNFVSDH